MGDLPRSLTQVVEDGDLPEDYQPCGTCGFDHSYDADYPGILRLIEQAHLLSGDSMNETKPARLDADRTAKPLTRLVKHPPSGDCCGPFTHLDSLEYEGEDGSRTELTHPMQGEKKP